MSTVPSKPQHRCSSRGIHRSQLSKQTTKDTGNDNAEKQLVTPPVESFLQSPILAVSKSHWFIVDIGVLPIQKVSLQSILGILNKPEPVCNQVFDTFWHCSCQCTLLAPHVETPLAHTLSPQRIVVAHHSKMVRPYIMAEGTTFSYILIMIPWFTLLHRLFGWLPPWIGIGANSHKTAVFLPICLGLPLDCRITTPQLNLMLVGWYQKKLLVKSVVGDYLVESLF